MAMTPKEFEEKMDEIIDTSGDEEECHVRMDELMCEVLNELGYDRGVKAFQETPKYYA